MLFQAVIEYSDEEWANLEATIPHNLFEASYNKETKLLSISCHPEYSEELASDFPAMLAIFGKFVSDPLCSRVVWSRNAVN